MRVVLDPNVLISALLFGGVPEQPLRRGLDGSFDMASSETLLDELEDKLRDRFRFGRARARLVREELEAAVDLAVPEEVPAVARDADDDHVLAAAVAGSEDVIVTGDKDLLVLERHAGVRIMTVGEFGEQAD